LSVRSTGGIFRSEAREASGSEAARVIRLIFKPVKWALLAPKVSGKSPPRHFGFVIRSRLTRSQPGPPFWINSTLAGRRPHCARGPTLAGQFSRNLKLVFNHYTRFSSLLDAGQGARALCAFPRIAERLSLSYEV